MNITPQILLIICPLVFAAGFIDSIAGGGGLIALPSYLFIGLSPYYAFGTNKFSASCGTLLSTIRFIRNKQVNYKSALISVAGALIGSFLGARLALSLDEKYLKYFLVIFLPIIAVFVVTRRKFGETDRSHLLSNIKMIFLSAASGLIIGAYDGFFGPGTGTFLILIYTSIIGFNITIASGNTKVVNLASNISALVTFLLAGKVLIALAIPTALFNILGNWIGSGLAIKNGAKIIRPIFIVVLSLLFTSILLDIFHVNIVTVITKLFCSL